MRPPRAPLAVDEDVIDAMRAFGAPPEDIARAEALLALAEQEGAGDVFLVDADNWLAVQLFLDLQGQWEWLALPMGGVVRTSLPAERVAAYLDKTLPRRRHRRLMRDIALMANAALDAERELREQEKD